MVKKGIKPKNVSFRKMEIVERRNPDISSMEEAHRILEGKDIDQSQIIAAKRKLVHSNGKDKE